MRTVRRTETDREADLSARRQTGRHTGVGKYSGLNVLFISVTLLVRVHGVHGNRNYTKNEEDGGRGGRGGEVVRRRKIRGEGRRWLIKRRWMKMREKMTNRVDQKEGGTGEAE